MLTVSVFCSQPSLTFSPIFLSILHVSLICFYASVTLENLSAQSPCPQGGYSLERRGDRQTCCQVAVSYKIKLRELPGSPVFRTLLSLLRAWVQFLVWELRAHKPPDEAKEKKRKEKKNTIEKGKEPGSGSGHCYL